MTELHSYDEFLAAVNQEGRVAVKFTSPSWCAPCRAFKPHWERAKSEVDGVTFYEVVELDANEWAMVELGITTQPTTLVYTNGALTDTIVGALGGVPLITRLRS